MSKEDLLYGELTEKIIGVYYEVCSELKPGYLEILYQRAMEIALREAGIQCESEVPVTVYFRGHSIGTYRTDLIAENRVILECKIADRIAVAHRVQVLNFLKASNQQVALILNFGANRSLVRLVNETSRNR